MVSFCIICSASPAHALTVLSVSANANCDAVTGITFSGSTTATIRDGAGIVVAWAGASGPFIPFEGPTNNTQWTVTDTGGSPTTIVPSTFASQCAPASLTVSAGDFNATVVHGGAANPPSKTYTLSNTGGSAIYLPATAYFPNGIAFFNLSGVTTIGPHGSINVTVTFNAAASSLAFGSHGASVAFSNAAKLSVVTTRQITLAVLAAVSHDFNGDAKSDIAWRQSGGTASVWLMNGAQVAQSGSFGVVPTNWSIVGQRDFNGDSKNDLLWRDGSGNTAIWLLNGLSILQTGGLGNIPTNWSVVGTTDFNADGKGDILWKDNTGNVAIWLMNGLSILQTGGLGNVGTSWNVAGTADFNGDGNGDILWKDTSGNVAIWLMNGLAVLQTGGLGNVGTTWSVAGTADFNGDGKGDVLWKDTSGNVAIWLMNGLQVLQTGGLGNVGTSWNVAQTGDYNGDGMSDILWRDTSGNTAIWFMNGLTISSTAGLGNIPTVWTVQGVNAD